MNTGTIHQEQYLMLTVKLGTGTATLRIKNDEAVGFVDVELDEGLSNIFLRPCQYEIVVTGDALVGVS